MTKSNIKYEKPNILGIISEDLIKVDNNLNTGDESGDEGPDMTISEEEIIF